MVSPLPRPATSLLDVVCAVRELGKAIASMRQDVVVLGQAAGSASRALTSQQKGQQRTIAAGVVDAELLAWQVSDPESWVLCLFAHTPGGTATAVGYNSMLADVSARIRFGCGGAWQETTIDVGVGTVIGLPAETGRVLVSHEGIPGLAAGATPPVVVGAMLARGMRPTPARRMLRFASSAAAPLANAATSAILGYPAFVRQLRPVLRWPAGALGPVEVIEVDAAGNERSRHVFEQDRPHVVAIPDPTARGAHVVNLTGADIDFGGLLLELL